MKRARQDGHLSKEEYEAQAAFTEYEGVFARATPSTLRSRRMVRARTPDRRREYLEAVKNLNNRFQAWVGEQIERDTTVNLMENAQEYLAYIAQLNSRYLKKQGEVFTFGNGECGQCAHGDASDADIIVTTPRVVYSLRNKLICHVACGGLHNAAVTADGKVLTWGCNDDGALGRDGDEKVPMVIRDLVHETVIGVAAGDSHTLALTLQGRVYGWGCYKDTEGQAFFHAASYHDIQREQKTPLLIQHLEGVLDIQAGSRTNLALLANGTVVSFGIGEKGQLGRRINMQLKQDAVREGEKPPYDLSRIFKEHLTPWPVQLADGSLATQGVRAIGCGAYHSMLVMAVDFEVYSTGLNNYGQLGLGDTENRDLFTHVAALDGKSITQVTGGEHHSMALSEPIGRLYAFGRSDSGQLGLGSSALETGGSRSTPEPITFPTDRSGNQPWVTSVSCGGSFTLAVSADNMVYSWGYGDCGALGHKPQRGKSEPSDEHTPREIDFSDAGTHYVEILKAAAGGQHSIIIARVPVAYMEEVKRKLEVAEEHRQAKRRKREAEGLPADEEDDMYNEL